MRNRIKKRAIALMKSHSWQADVSIIFGFCAFAVAIIGFFLSPIYFSCWAFTCGFIGSTFGLGSFNYKRGEAGLFLSIFGAIIAVIVLICYLFIFGV